MTAVNATRYCELAQCCGSKPATSSSMHGRAACRARPCRCMAVKTEDEVRVEAAPRTAGGRGIEYTQYEANSWMCTFLKSGALPARCTTR